MIKVVCRVYYPEAPSSGTFPVETNSHGVFKEKWSTPAPEGGQHYIFESVAEFNEAAKLGVFRPANIFAPAYPIVEVETTDGDPAPSTNLPDIQTLRSIVANGPAIRLNALAKSLNCDPAAIRAMIETKGSAMSLAKAGWVSVNLPK